MNIGARIAAFIQEKKKEKKFSQAEFARSIDVSPVAVSLWISGEREPAISYAKKIAKAMGITVDELVDEDFNSSKSRVFPDSDNVGKCRQFNPVALHDAILAIDAILKNNQLEITIEAYAELIPLAYEEWLDDGNMQDKKKRLLRLVAK